MIRTDLLHGEIARAGLTKKYLAEKMDITPKTFYSKLKKGQFTNDEITVLVRECGIRNPMPIFFPDLVTEQVTES